jgi:hypothetical protein
MSADTKDDTKDEAQVLTPIELERIAPMPEASRLSGLSEDSLRRHYPDQIIDLSPRRQGMRVRDALMLTTKKS